MMRIHIKPVQRKPLAVIEFQEPAANAAGVGQRQKQIASKSNFSKSDTPLETARNRAVIQVSPSFRSLAKDSNGDLAVGANSSAAREVDDPTSEWGSGSRDFARTEDLGRYDRLYDLIDARVQYPNVLASHQIQGTVNARLIVNPDGQCVWKQTSISSSQAYLKIYVLDVLKSVCLQNLTRFARRDSNSNLDLSFTFQITEHNDKQLIEAQKRVVGNAFLFYRNSQQSIAEWHLGPFHGMFPIPYVSLDFNWLMENYEKVMNSKDPLNEFKNHIANDPAS